jgi:hypothetical protein
MEEKIEQFYRDATADDVARVVNGETVEARFRDEEHDSWSIALLFGWSMDEGRDWIDSGYDSWEQCQVYDPPAWFLNKPEPGEGYRLLGKFPDEPLGPKDQWWDDEDSEWCDATNASGSRCKQNNLWYRRRIETNNPVIPDSCKETSAPNSSHLGQIIEVRNYEDADWQRAELEAVFPHTEFAYVARVEKNTRDFPLNWRFGRLVQADCNSSESPNSSRSRDTIPSGWLALGKEEERLASDAYWSLGCKEWLLIGDDRVAIANESPRGHAIRRIGSFDLVVGFNYTLPNGQTIRITAKGFEVL